MEPRYNEFNIEVVKKSNSPLIKIMKNSYEKKLKAQKEKERQEECKLLSSQTKGVNIVKVCRVFVAFPSIFEPNIKD